MNEEGIDMSVMDEVNWREGQVKGLDSNDEFVEEWYFQNQVIKKLRYEEDLEKLQKEQNVGIKKAWQKAAALSRQRIMEKYNANKKN